TDLVEALTAQRAEERVGQQVEVLVETVGDDGREGEGRAAHQAPEVDGSCTVRSAAPLTVGQMVTATVVASSGVDLVVEVVTDRASPSSAERLLQPA
ncbi:MAG TPA: hypothetical protein VF288_10330, partial [Mycobacteriales bacterium]